MDRRSFLRLSLILNVLLLAFALYAVHLNRAFFENSEGGEAAGWSNLLVGAHDAPAQVHSPSPEQQFNCGICEAGEVGRRLCDEWGEAAMSRAIAYAGSNHRLRRALAKMRAGQPFSLGVIGGSVSAGHGLGRDQWRNMHNIFFEHLNRMFPLREPAIEGNKRKDGVHNIFRNGAEPGRGSDYFSMCQQLHVSDDVDIVVVEQAINDPPHLAVTHNFENLIRALLKKPSQPAVLMSNVWALSFEQISMGGDLNMGNAQYYDVPIVSARNVALPTALANHTVLVDWFAPVNNKKPRDPETLENVDLRHFGAPMHKLAGDLMAAYVETQMCEMDRLEARRPGASIDELYPIDSLPRLRLQDRFYTDRDSIKLEAFCMATNSDEFPLKASKQNGWKEWAWKDKKYLVADTVGASLTFDFATTAAHGQVILYYLRSWEFPLGNFKCWVDDDKEKAKILHGRWNYKMNIGATEKWSDLRPGKHQLHCEILKETDDPKGGHEVRLMALMSV